MSAASGVVRSGTSGIACVDSPQPLGKILASVGNAPRKILQLNWVSNELKYSSNVLLKNETELKVSGEMVASNPETMELLRHDGVGQ